jgi:hypothetical protein
MKELLKALELNGYKPFDSQKEAHDFLLERYEKIENYVHTVYMQHWNNISVRRRLSDDEMRREIERIDRNRTMVHNAAMDAINQLNRLGNMFGIEKVVDIDTIDRKVAARGIGEFVLETFKKQL